MPATLQGRKVSYSGKGQLPVAGDYWKFVDGFWHGCCPNGLFCNLSKHTVKMNDDGTITVTPSILCGYNGGEQWHGYLTAGVWTEC